MQTMGYAPPMDIMVEVGQRELADLLDLSGRAVQQLRENEGHSTLADALHGATAAVRQRVFQPA